MRQRQESKVMKDENKNQNEVKVLGYINGKAEEAGNSESVKEICAILRTGADMLKGKKIAKEFCDFVRGNCKKGEESAFLWGHDKKTNALALDWMATQLKGIWWSLDERHTKIKETMKWMLRVLWIDTERDGGFTTKDLHRLFEEAGVIW
jgi:hypothetical protein